jgi:hypothetical protein
MLKQKQAVAPLIILLLLGVGIFLLASNFNLKSLNLGDITGGNGGYIERPIFYYIKCEATQGGLAHTDPVNIANAGQFITPPTTSKSYSVSVTTPKIGISLQTHWFKYSVCRSEINSQANCQIYNKETEIPQGLLSGNSQIMNIPDVTGTDHVYLKFECGVFSPGDCGGAQYQINWIPYGLRAYDVLTAPQGDINTNDCRIPDMPQTQDQVLRTDSAKASGYVSPNSNENVFQPDERRWYVSGYVSSLSDSFVLTYQGKSAWCRDGKIYKINTITTTTGTYKIASPDYSDYLGSLTCCPGITTGSGVCKSDGSGYESIQNSECGTFKSCGSPNPVSYSTQQTIQYSCVDGKCQSKITPVECSSSYDCKDANKVCNTNTWKCVAANVALDGQVIITIPDNLADCQRAGGTWKSKTSTTKTGALCIWGYGLCKDNTIVNEYCDMGSGTKWYTWIIIIVVVILALILLVRMWPMIYGWVKLIPIIGRVLP